MKSIELLGGNYDGLEQITLGTTQAFRAQDRATGRSVFIHRVSTTEAPEEQAALLKMLTTVLMKSSEAKRLVLDSGEDSGYWYVVTESEPQCALLRDWLQVQVDSVVANSRQSGNAATRPKKAEEPILRPTPAAAPSAAAVIRPSTPSGENSPAAVPVVRTPAAQPMAEARFEPAQTFAPAQSSTPERSEAEEKTQLLPSAQRPASTADVEHASKAGEFTQFFKQSPPEKQAAPAVAPVPIPEPKPVAPSTPAHGEREPGEFTRFFSTASQTPAPPAPAPAAQPFQQPQRLPNSPQVQRPARGSVTVPVAATPVAPAAPLFVPPAVVPPAAPPLPVARDTAWTPAAPPAVPAPPAAPAAGDASAPGEFTRFFSASSHLSRETPARPEKPREERFEMPPPVSAARQEEGEFTRMFGATGPASSMPAPPAVAAQPKPKSLLDEHIPLITQPIQSVPPTPHVVSDDAPGEFTRVMRGGYTPSKPVVPTSAPFEPKISAAVPKIALPQAAAATPAKSNKNVIIFLVVLGVLAVLLILAFVFLMKK